MQTLTKIQSTLFSRKNDLFKRFQIKNLAVFGSFARGEQQNDSDADILVEFDQPVGIEFIDLVNYLEDLLKIRVDLVSRKGIKPKYFEQIKDDLKYV